MPRLQAELQRVNGQKLMDEIEMPLDLRPGRDGNDRRLAQPALLREIVEGTDRPHGQIEKQVL